MAPQRFKLKSSSNAGRRQPGGGNPTASDCSVTGSCSRTVGGRRRKHQRQRRSIGGKLVSMPHKWTTEETKAFMDAAKENSRFLMKGKYRSLIVNKIRGSMKDKSNVDLSIEIVRTKFYTCMKEWRKFNDLKSIAGSNFNPETGAFDASEEWWQQRTQDERRFKKHRPYLLELDELFKHMEEVGNTSSGWDSDYSRQYRCSECRQSVTPQSVQSKIPPESGFLDQKEAAQEILKGNINMEQCTHKLQRCGFSDQQLWHAIDMLKADLELRQVFISLGDREAKGYILHVLRNSHDPTRVSAVQDPHRC